MNKWRPDWWFNRYGCTGTNDNSTRQEAFEAGADAMLEALKNLPKQSFISTSPILKTGYYVFIPDDLP